MFQYLALGAVLELGDYKFTAKKASPEEEALYGPAPVPAMPASIKMSSGMKGALTSGPGPIGSRPTTAAVGKSYHPHLHWYTVRTGYAASYTMKYFRFRVTSDGVWLIAAARQRAIRWGLWLVVDIVDSCWTCQLHSNLFHGRLYSIVNHRQRAVNSPGQTSTDKHSCVSPFLDVMLHLFIDIATTQLLIVISDILIVFQGTVCSPRWTKTSLQGARSFLIGQPVTHFPQLSFFTI